jgi:hypothetical protein
VSRAWALAAACTVLMLSACGILSLPHRPECSIDRTEANDRLLAVSESLRSDSIAFEPLNEDAMLFPGACSAASTGIASEPLVSLDLYDSLKDARAPRPTAIGVAESWAKNEEADLGDWDVPGRVVEEQSISMTCADTIVDNCRSWSAEEVVVLPDGAAIVVAVLSESAAEGAGVLADILRILSNT